MCVFYLGRQVVAVSGGRQRGEPEARLAAGERGRSLDERRSVSEGAEPSLLGEQLLVGHGVDGVREGEGRAEGGGGPRQVSQEVTRWTGGKVDVTLPEPSHRQVSVRAAGGRAGARVVDVGHERVGRRADHRLEVDASVGQRRDRQRSLPAESWRQPGTGETRHCGRKHR